MPEDEIESRQQNINKRPEDVPHQGPQPTVMATYGSWLLFVNLCLCEISAIYQGGLWAALSLSIANLIAILIAVLGANRTSLHKKSF